VRDLIGKRNWFFAFSLILTIPALIFILLGPLTGGAAGLKFSIDYTGGTKWEVRFEDRTVTPEQVKAVLAAEGFGDSIVQTTSDSFLLIRTVPIGFVMAPSPSPEASAVTALPSSSPAAGASAAPSGSVAPSPSVAPSGSPGAPAASAAPATPVAPGQVSRTGEIGVLAAALEAKLGPLESQRQLTTIGPIISSELTQQAILLVLVGSIGILLWMTFRFRDFRFGMTALVALIHDVIVVVGSFAVLGTFFGLEVDGLFVTAMLTIIGFSVHDTIVVYDRIRENRSRHAGERFSNIVNHSILQTLARSINTSLTVIFTLTALFLFGGDSIRPFILALLIGITSGTYSSIFNAAPLLTVWEEWEARRKERATPGRPVRRASA
jgi:preprotein translocase subunit SecF